MDTYIFDGTLPGLLTAVFESYVRRAHIVKLETAIHHQPTLMGTTVTVLTDEQSARRVWKGLSERVSAQWLLRWYTASLSEDPAGYQHLFELSRTVFDVDGDVTDNYGNPHVLYITQLDRKIHREKHRMEAFVRFQLLADGIFYAAIEPDFDVLPLIGTHFKRRYADQRWIIYDQKRRYGLYYDCTSVREVELHVKKAGDRKAGVPTASQLAEEEALYQELWKAYFRHTTIATRKNTKLHIRHVPRRYWKYLTEKQ